MKKKKNHSNNFFYLLITPLLLAFIILVIIPIITYSNNIYSFNDNLNLPNFMHNQLFNYVSSLENIESAEKLLFDLETFEKEFNIRIIKDNELIYNAVKIENVPTTTITKTISINNIENYELSISTPIVTEKIIYMGLVIRYILLAFCIVSFLSINKIRKHIVKLKNETDNIASGDYETPIKTEKDCFQFLDDSLENMRIQIREDYHQISRFFAGVSHDLKTPLSSIMGYTQALKDGLAETKEDEIKYLNIIYEKSSLLENRISSLINYIRLSDQGFTMNLEEKELYPYLENLTNQTEAELSLKNIEFVCDLKINKKYITKFDKTLLDRIFENLIENAIKYGDTTKPISFKATQNYEGIFISLSNFNKKNISKEEIKHLFEPFYRGDNSRKGNGFGLGLATVKSIISSHEWKIKSELNETDNTIIFTINIPNY